jgi:hypothetical protein
VTPAVSRIPTFVSAQQAKFVQVADPTHLLKHRLPLRVTLANSKSRSPPTYNLSIFSAFAQVSVCPSITSLAPMSLTTSATSAVTSMQALTTPFVYAEACSDTSFITTSINGWKDSTIPIEIELLVPDLADDRFSSCQPSGWSSRYQMTAFSFSPAVCPSGWTAYNLMVGNSDTVATCCERHVARSLWNHVLRN